MTDNNKLAIVFDFGGVLVDWDPRYLYQKFFDGDAAAMERFLVEVDFSGWNKKQDAGRPFAVGVPELSARFPHYAHLIRAYDERYEESLAGPIWPTVEIVRELKLAGYPLYALSNWPYEKFLLVRPRYEFFGWFDSIVISGDVKLCKPEAPIFRVLLERIGRPASECLFIDDADANIATAVELGFQTIRYRSPEQLRGRLREIGLLE